MNDSDVTTVHDGWARYELSLETRERRRGMQYRWVIDRDFARMERGWSRGRWTYNRDKAIARGRRKLLGLRPVKHDREEL